MKSLLARRAHDPQSVAVRSLAFPLVAIAVAAVILFAVISGGAEQLSNAQLVGQIAAMLIATLGLNLLVGNAGMHSFGQGAFFGIGAYTFMYTQQEWNWPALMSFVAAVAVPAVFGGAVAIATTRMRGPQLAMVTLILAVVVQRFLSEATALGQFGGYPNVAKHESTLLDPPSLFGLKLEAPLFGDVVPTALILTVVLAVVSLLVCRRLMASAWGRSLSTIKESELLAAHLGVNVYLRKIALLAFTSAMAGLGGACYALIFAHLQPETFTLMLGVNMIVMVILGGAGTVLGPVVGTAVVVYLQTSSTIGAVVDAQTRYLSDAWFLSAQGLIALIMLLTLFLLPAGIVGSLADLVKRRFPRHRTRRSTAEPPPEPAAAVREPRTSPDGHLLSMVDASLSFGGVRAVNGVSLTVDPGQILALIGPNGAGKSTVVNLISGVYRGDAGRIEYRGQDISSSRSHERARAGIGRTFQTPIVSPDLTVYDNVRSGAPEIWSEKLGAALFSRGRGGPTSSERVGWALDAVGLAPLVDLTPEELSYGQRRALELARALASGPSVLILDEPAAGLNESETAELSDLLRRLAADGLAIILVEHHMDLVREVADHALCLIEGTPLVEGTPAAVLADPRVAAAYLGIDESEVKEESRA